MLTIQPVNPHVNITSKLAIYYQVNQNVPVKQCAPGGNTKSQARDTLAFWEGSKFYTRLLFSSATLPSGQRSLLLRRRDFSGLYQVYKVFPCSRLQRTWSGLFLTQGPLRDEASVPSEVQICNNTSGPSMHPQAAKRGFWKCLRANESYQTPHLMTEKTKIHAFFFFLWLSYLSFKIQFNAKYLLSVWYGPCCKHSRFTSIQLGQQSLPSSSLHYSGGAGDKQLV